jgi:1-acyl-sn-glycerol-3-phosphate acyltransferase
MLLNLIKFIFRKYFLLFYKVKVTGLDNIPLSGGLIIACNHLSNFDPPLAGGFAGLRRDSIYFVKKELMSVPLLGRLFKSLDFIPVDRKKPGGDLSALKAALKIVKKGESLFIFPEGTRSKTGRPGRAKPGIGFLLYYSGALILPVKVKHTDKLPFTRSISVTYGEPFKIEPDASRKVKEQFQDFADKVMQKINTLD